MKNIRISSKKGTRAQETGFSKVKNSNVGCMRPLGYSAMGKVFPPNESQLPVLD